MVNLIGICIAAALWSGTYIENDIAPEIISASQEYVEKMEQLKGEAEPFLLSPVVSDFLAMDSEDFENKYDRNQLYEGDILYCDMVAWQYHGTQLDGFQNPEDYYDVINIAALRYMLDDRLYDFVEENHIDTDSPVDSSSTTDVYIQHMGDYVISFYFQKNSDGAEEDSEKLLEISFVKVELREGEAPRALYQYLEDDYYYGRENILYYSRDWRGGCPEDWIISPDGNKEVCALNGWLPKHPAQIFVRFRDKRPDTVFRFTWEHEIAGWIDEEHFVCYRSDWAPMLIHLETNQTEDIEILVGDNGRRVFDSYGVHYEINDNQLVAKVLGEELYRWDIVKENQEVYIREKN